MCRAFRPNRFLVEWQVYRLIAIAARDLDRAIAARVNVAEMKGTCFILLHISNPKMQGRFVNAACNSPNRPLAMNYLVLHETSVDYLGESDLFLVPVLQASRRQLRSVHMRRTGSRSRQNRSNHSSPRGKFGISMANIHRKATRETHGRQERLT